MARQRHLPHAPITEALIDIHVIPRDGLTFAGLKSALNKANFGYYIKNPISQGTFAFSLAPDGQPPQTAADAAQIGLRLHSADEKYVAQFRLAGFTLSRLPPYEKWENLLEEARRLWAIYVERLAPTRVVRVDGMPAPGSAPVILDVDAFTGVDINPTDQKLWTILERLRELKNRSFFGTITERAAELYE
jgi:hypothetical protein